MGADSLRARHFACSESDFSAVGDEWGEEIREHRLHLSTSRYGSMFKAGEVDFQSAAPSRTRERSETHENG